MRYTHHERLSALDASFLALESRNSHMHVGAVALFEAAPFRAADGVIDLERFRRLIEAGIHRVPRYQQRLEWTPIFGNPVWVDDDRFNLNYHIRHVSLPKPGDERLLKRLAGRILSQQLDRGKPLWELWIVDGLEGDRLATIVKVHHCMIDGVGGVALGSVLMGPSADAPRGLDNPPRWIVRPAPSGTELALGELWRRAARPAAVLARAARDLGSPARLWARVREAVGGAVDAVAAGLSPASATPLNDEVGPHRRFDWTEMPLAEVKRLGAGVGATVNDVILSIAAGALARFLHGRGLETTSLDFRALIPVNVREPDRPIVVGNRVSLMLARLAMEERDPVARLRLTHEIMRDVKRSRQKAGVEDLEAIGDLTSGALFAAFAKLALWTRPFNIVITNIPGPSFPTYLLGARMQAVYPLVPLFGNQALGIALCSYSGSLYWGFNADWDAVPDLHDLVHGVQREFDALRATLPAAVTEGGARVLAKTDAGARNRRRASRGVPRAAGR